MTFRKHVVATLVLTGVGLAWNGVLHLFVLRAIEEPVRHLFRRDLSVTLFLQHRMTVGVSFVSKFMS